ncbi:hypothetical protein B7463_g11800, partial [Scytalidium lignicola]
MSDISSPTPPPAGSKKPSKRPRNDDEQRERKRELDRRAQRNSREKQRLYIARLEKTIEILQKDNGNAATTELMEEIQRLRGANDHLCGIIERIRGALSLSTCEAPLRPLLPSPEYDKIQKVGVTGHTESEAITDAWPTEPFDSMQPWPEFKTGHLKPQSYLPNGSTVTTNVDSIEPQDSIGSFMPERRVSCNRSDINRAWTFIGPLATNMPIPKQPDIPFGRLWKRSNDIYGQIFKVPPPLAAPAALLPSRYYGGYYLKPDRTVWDEIPSWQRPIHSQTTKEHPVALDFFCWPALRERLLNTHTYFHIDDFSAFFSRYYKFKWPFPPEQSFIYHKETDTYELTPLFEQCYSELRFWTIEEPFFQRFPELSKDISDLQDKADPLFPTSYTSGASYRHWNAESNKVDRMVPNSFTDPSMMQLFDDFPQIV